MKGEVKISTVKPIGNGAGVHLPKKWIDETVRVESLGKKRVRKT